LAEPGFLERFLYTPHSIEDLSTILVLVPKTQWPLRGLVVVKINVMDSGKPSGENSMYFEHHL
jgi:hypothetical protein